MKKPLLLLAVFVAVGASAAAYVEHRSEAEKPTLVLKEVTRGDVVQTVVATGPIEPMRIVDVGTQVSGIVAALHADFDSIVHKGEVIAEIDPAIFQTNLEVATASLERTRVALASDQDVLALDEKDLQRADDLLGHSLETQADRDTLAAQESNDELKVKQDESDIVVAQAAIDQAKLDLEHCTITSPVDGVVIARDVDAGQAVASRMTVPTLFEIATDLKKLRVVGDVDESEVSQVRTGQDVTFTVEAYPEQTFHGIVDETRLNATTAQNVVTYQVVVTADNPDLLLMPGMTANLSIVTATDRNVIRVPSSALRFRPTNEILAEFNGPGAMAPPRPPAPPLVDETTLVGGRVGPAAPLPVGLIDQLFGAIPKPMSTGQVWIQTPAGLKAVTVTVGVSDDQWTEILKGDLTPGQQVVMNVRLPVNQAAATRQILPVGRFGGRGRF